MLAELANRLNFRDGSLQKSRAPSYTAVPAPEARKRDAKVIYKPREATGVVSVVIGARTREFVGGLHEPRASAKARITNVMSLRIQMSDPLSALDLCLKLTVT
ncbi:hypothetical protein NMY22_g7702 [Coprinellus aureogranulatus]|nr:hypothetical protein NMY22_g7702 [Coprinellus aureogranulatus]